MSESDRIARFDEPSPPPEDDRRLVRIGGISVGFVKAVTCREDSVLVYEVEPLPAWRGPYQERREIEP